MHDKQNIFQIWKENDEKLPFKARIDSWSESKGHYVLVEQVEIKEMPYGKAFGQYFFYGKAGKRGMIKNAGAYRWSLVQ